MSTEIKTPEAMAERMWPSGHPNRLPRHRREREACRGGIDADREQIATWCDEHAAAAKREAQTHGEQRDAINYHEDPDAFDAKSERIVRCEGQASFAEALAAILRGGR